MADFIKQRHAILKGVEEMRLMIRAHGDDQIQCVQELRAHLAVSVVSKDPLSMPQSLPLTRIQASRPF
jgi:hypothetical protein